MQQGVLAKQAWLEEGLAKDGLREHHPLADAGRRGRDIPHSKIVRNNLG